MSALRDFWANVVGAGPAASNSPATKAGPAVSNSPATKPVLEKIEIVPADSSLVIGGQQQFLVEGTEKGNTKSRILDNLRDGIDWSTSDRNIVSITWDGRATMRRVGTATITAIAGPGKGVKATATVKVLAPGAGARKVSVQITVNDFEGKSMDGVEGVAVFTNPTAKDVTIRGLISGGSFVWPDLWLMPQGTIQFKVVRPGKSELSHTVKYALPTSGNLMFSATQKSKTGKVSATTKEEAVETIGVKGTEGVDYKIVKLEREVNKEKEHHRGKETTVEWEVTQGADGLDLVQT
jgi:hypothetical protein